MTITKSSLSLALAAAALCITAGAGATGLTSYGVPLELDTVKRIEAVTGSPLPTGPFPATTNELDAYRSYRLTQLERLPHPVHKLIHARWQACTHDACVYELAERESLLMHVYTRRVAGDTAPMARVEGAVLAAQPAALDASGDKRNVMLTEVIYSTPLNTLRAVIKGVGDGQ